MDEAAIQMNMPVNKTVHKVGAKSIIIKTQRQKKVKSLCISYFSL